MATSTIHQSTMPGSFKVTTLSNTYSNSGTGNTTVTVSGSEPGWTPIAVVGFRSGYVNMYPYSITPTFSSGSASVLFLLHNVTSTASGSRTVSAHVLWTR